MPAAVSGATLTVRELVIFPRDPVVVPLVGETVRKLSPGRVFTLAVQSTEPGLAKTGTVCECVPWPACALNSNPVFPRENDTGVFAVTSEIRQMSWVCVPE